MEQEEAAFIEFLRRTGQKATRTRRAILEEVFRHHDHFDAEELFARLQTRQSGVSRATVYRTLALLDRCGLVRKMGVGDTRSRYEHTLGHPHHDHLICLRCNRIFEFSHPRIESIQEEVCQEHNFSMASHSLQIYGHCAECQSA